MGSDFRVGDCRVRLEHNLILRGDDEIHIEHKAMEVLTTLAQHPGELVSKGELMDTVWTDTFVTEHVLTNAISELRKAFADDPQRPHVIQTIPRQGYRLIASVSPLEKSVSQYQTAHVRTNLALVQEAIRGPWPLPTPEKKRGVWIGAAALMILGVGLIATWLYLSLQRPEKPAMPLRITPLTSEPSRQFQPTFSPDGEQIAFVWGVSDEKTDIHVRRVDGEGSLQLTDHLGQDLSPSWSPDGSQIAFWRYSDGEREILTISPLGGKERRLFNQTFQARRWDDPRAVVLKTPLGLSWSPDGEFIAYPDRSSAEEPWGIYLLSTKTGEKRKLTAPPADRRGSGYHWPSFSPDGTYLASWRYEEDEGSYVLCILPFEGGDPKELIRESYQASGVAWMADSREIVFSSARQASLDRPALWRIAVSGGDPRRIDAAGEGTLFPAISPQGDRLSYSVWSWNLDIVQLELEGIDKVRTSTQLIASARMDANPQISPGGKKIAFSSSRTGQEQIWTCNSDGTDPVRLTQFNATDTSAPSWSPNGRFIAFNSLQEGDFDIYVVDSQGGPARRLTTESSYDVLPSWSADGRWIYFSSNRSGDFQIWRVPAEGGKPIQVTTNGGFKGEETTDGKWLYYVQHENESDLWRMPVSGGQETLVLQGVERRGWALTDDGIYLLNPDTKPKPSLQFFDFATGELRHLTEMPENVWAGGDLRVAPDGSWLVFVTQTLEEDIMLIDHFR